MSESLRIIEVGPRDGLQNVAQPVSLEIRRQYVQLLLDAGLRELEVGAFVRADRVPQMADSEKILDGINLKGARAYFLVPNEKGLERAIATGVQSIAVFTAATDAFNQKNIGMTMEESRKVLQKVVREAVAKRLQVRGYVSVVWGCPYQGATRLEDVRQMTRVLLEAGCFEVSLGDTIGVARPPQVEQMLETLGKDHGMQKLAVHFHDTRGMAVTNVTAALRLGIRAVDASSGGLGGCPFAPGASGNVGTEDVVYLAQSLGLKTGVDLKKLSQASQHIYRALGGMPFSSKTLQALVASPDKFQ